MTDQRHPPPDWQLPPGVNCGLWDYLHSESVARNYDAGLTGSSLFQIDQAYVERHCPTPGRSTRKAWPTACRRLSAPRTMPSVLNRQAA